MTVLDLDALSTADTADLTIKHPKTGAALGVVTLAGPGHPQTLAWEETERQRAVADLQDYQRRTREALDAGERTPPTPEEGRTVADIRARNGARLAARVVSADFSIKIGGKEVEFGPDTAGAILANPRLPWLFVQVAKCLDDVGNFMPASPGA